MARQSNELIDLGIGRPNRSLVAAEQLQRNVSSIFAYSNMATLQNALGHTPEQGDRSFRTDIATWLTAFYHPSEKISADEICITGGASQGLASLLQVFTDPIYTRNVWISIPTYQCAPRIFEDAGFHARLRGIHEDSEGIDVNWLLAQLALSGKSALEAGNHSPMHKPTRSWGKIFKHVIYLVPTFSNPSGAVTSRQRREALIRCAREHDALIIADDIYDMLQWPSNADKTAQLRSQALLPRLVDIDAYLDGGRITDFGNSISNGSFSKLLGPGCRTGWVQASSKLAYGLSQAGVHRSGGCPSQLAAAMISPLLPFALSRHIMTVLLPSLARRHRKTVEAVSRCLIPLGVAIPRTKFDNMSGGYFIWLRLPEGISAQELEIVARGRHDVTFLAGINFDIPDVAYSGYSRFDQMIRTCSACVEEEQLVSCIRRMYNALRSSSSEGA